MNLLYNEADAGLGNAVQHNGNISAIKWNNFLGQASIKELAYIYTYDALMRLTSRTYKEKSTSTWSIPTNNTFNEYGMSYDLNGNVLTLSRNDKRTTGTMDILAYNYGSGTSLSNKLLRITDTGDKTKGFIDGANTGNDYTYDNNGNMLTDQNKSITGNISYNHLNLPVQVIKSTSERLFYTYNASGNRLTQNFYTTTGLLQKTTDYMGEFVYENDTLKFIDHELGRVIAKGTEYQYHLKDHLGNVKLTFTSKMETESPTATNEPANALAEHGKFVRYENAKRINSTLFDRTNGAAPGYSQRLNGSANEKYGLARSISVMPGDVINAEVYAKYVDPVTTNWNTALTTLMSNIAAGTAGVVVDGANYTTSTSSFPASYLGLVTKTDNGAPKAYLNWLIFDRNFAFVNGGFQQISTACRETGLDVAHERLASPRITITQPGYAYIYISNDNTSQVDVFFDDFNVSQTKSPIIQMDDYYSHGGEYNSYSKESSVPNFYKFNDGSELQDEMGLNVYLTDLRTYDPWGRLGWWQIDPKADQGGQESWSQYHYGFDNPIRYNDPKGDCPPGVPCVNPLPTMQIRQNRASNLGPGLVRTNTDGTARQHSGHDLYSPTGTQVSSSMAGTVTSAGNTDPNGYGNSVVIRTNIHPAAQTNFVGPPGTTLPTPEGQPITPEDFIYVQYSHLATINVEAGATVTAGQNLGTVGTTGNAQGMTGDDEHLHIQVGTSTTNGLVANNSVVNPNLVYNNVTFSSADLNATQGNTGVIQTTTNPNGTTTNIFQQPFNTGNAGNSILLNPVQVTGTRITNNN